MVHERGPGAHKIDSVISKTAVFIITLFLTAFFSSCSDREAANHPPVLEGILGNESFYNSESFFTSETVDKTFEENDLDFWLFAFTPDSPERMNNFKDQLRKISRGYKKNKSRFFILSDQEPSITAAITGSQENKKRGDLSIFFPGTGTEEVSREEPPSLYNVISIGYSGKTDYYLDEYYHLLDQGHILGAGATSELLGPDWKVNSNLRMYIIPEKGTNEDIETALKQRRTYISFEKGTSINFSINHYPIGSVIEEQHSDFYYSVSVANHNNRTIEKIELVTNNGHILEKTDNIKKTSLVKDGNITIANSFAYVYLKVYFQNGNIAFTSPIWIKKQNKMKYLIHSIKSERMEKTRKGYISVDFKMENISSLPIGNTQVTVQTSNNSQIPAKLINLKIGESKALNFTFPSEGTNDTLITINARQGFWDISQSLVVKPKITGKKIVFDASHTNIFAGEMTKAQQLLEEKNYSVTTITDDTFFHSYDDLKKYDVLIITSPRKEITGAEDFSKLVYTLQKYVYYGGALVLTGYDDEKTVVSTVFINRLLKIMFSPLLFRMDRDLYHYPMYDEENNFKGNKNIPVFTNFSLSDVIDTKDITSVYFRNPIEIYAHNGVNEVQVGRHYSIESVVNFAETTKIQKRTLYTPETSSAGAVYKYGSGKVALLTGINFSDYDIENLDNKKWFEKLIAYLAK